MEPTPQPDKPKEPPTATPVSYLPDPPRRSRTARRVVMFLIVFGLIGSLMLNFLLTGLLSLTGLMAFETDGDLREEFVAGNADAEDKVAIIRVEGTILSGEGFVKRQIDRVMKDKNVKAVVLRVNSPGGTVTGSDFIYHHLCKLVKQREIPMVVSMGGLAASGGYYISMAVGDEDDVIFAEPTTWTGSIGVIIPRYDLSGLLKKHEVYEDSIVSGKFKAMGGFTKELSDEQRDILQQLVDGSFARFENIVKSSRPDVKEPQRWERVKTGRVFAVDEAIELKLVDKEGFIEDAVDRAVALAPDLKKDNFKVVEYEREPGLISLLLGAKTSGQSVDLSAVLDLATPRAYYLYTSMPLLAGNGRDQ